MDQDDAGDALIAVKPHMASSEAALVATEHREVPVLLDHDDFDAAVERSWRCNPGKVLPTSKSCAESNVAYRPHRIEREGPAQPY